MVVAEADERDRGGDAREQLGHQIDPKRRPRENSEQGIVEADAGIECAISDGAKYGGARYHAESDWPSVIVIDCVAIARRNLQCQKAQRAG